MDTALESKKGAKIIKKKAQLEGVIADAYAAQNLNPTRFMTSMPNPRNDEEVRIDFYGSPNIDGRARLYRSAMIAYGGDAPFVSKSSDISTTAGYFGYPFGLEEQIKILDNVVEEINKYREAERAVPATKK